MGKMQGRGSQAGVIGLAYKAKERCGKESTTLLLTFTGFRGFYSLREKSGLRLFLGGAAVYRCDIRLVFSLGFKPLR